MLELLILIGRAVNRVEPSPAKSRRLFLEHATFGPILKLSANVTRFLVLTVPQGTPNVSDLS